MDKLSHFGSLFPSRLARVTPTSIGLVGVFSEGEAVTRTEEGRRISDVAWSIFGGNNAYGESPEDERVIVHFVFKQALALGFMLGVVLSTVLIGLSR